MIKQRFLFLTLLYFGIGYGGPSNINITNALQSRQLGINKPYVNAAMRYLWLSRHEKGLASQFDRWNKPINVSPQIKEEDRTALRVLANNHDVLLSVHGTDVVFVYDRYTGKRTKVAYGYKNNNSSDTTCTTLVRTKYKDLSSRHGMVQIWDRRDGSLKEYCLPGDDITCLTMLDEDTIAAGSAYGSITILSNKPAKRLQQNDYNSVISSIVKFDGNKIFSGDSIGRIILWDLISEQQLCKIHTQYPIDTLAILEPGETVSREGKMQCWNVELLQERMALSSLMHAQMQMIVAGISNDNDSISISESIQEKTKKTMLTDAQSLLLAEMKKRPITNYKDGKEFTCKLEEEPIVEQSKSKKRKRN